MFVAMTPTAPEMTQKDARGSDPLLEGSLAETMDINNEVLFHGFNLTESYSENHGI